MHFSVPEVILSYSLIVIGGMLIFFALTHIVYQKRSPTGMIAWILFIVLMPFVAAPLYFVIGVRKRRFKNQKAHILFGEIEAYRPYYLDINAHPLVHILSKNGMPPATRANDFRLITSDTEAFDAIMQAIEDAEETIEMATYVFSIDTTTQKILEALTCKAQKGVKVRLLLDTVGSFGVYLRRKPFKALIEAGGEVGFFVPILKYPFQSYINLRNHRKIYLFDRRVLLSGGMNLSDEYMGPADGTKRWSDVMYRLEGPAVAYFYDVFKNDRYYATSKRLKDFRVTRHTFEGDSAVQVVPSGPDIPKDALYEALLDAIYNAKRRIWIVTPYFVPDDNLVQALIVARHKDIDVKLITPKQSDHLLTDIVRSSYMRDLERNGVEIVLYEGAMLHAKAILFDKTGGMVGSLNLDNRSLFLNYEIVTFVYSEDFIRSTERWMERLIAQSTVGMQPPSKLREAFENITRVVAPMM